MMRLSHRRARLARTSCSILALATACVVGSSPVAAQSFLGTGTATNGAATTIAHGPGTTTITVTAPQTVINWVPTDNATNPNVPIAFQNSGTTASFLGTGGFAVLNNVTATDLSRMISMNGTITTGALGGVGTANGSIYFYSPSGILLGGNSTINVGSLVLSASPIRADGSGNFVNGPARQVVFGQAPRATAAITTSVGSQINATAGDVYVAMVAPRVQHGGSINVNGSAALVAAEAAVINFSPDGLFDIQVTTGTTDAQGISVTGGITGPASPNASLARRAFLVAVPKNTALTMLIGSGADLGFDVAGAANVSGNTVILSAGHDVADGAIGGVSAGSAAGTLANLQVNDGTFTSAVSGEATGFAHFSAFSAIYFHSAVDVHADGDILFSTQGPGATIDIDGSLDLSTERFGLFGQSIGTSLVNLYTINGGGRITVDGSTTLNSNAHGGSSGTSGINGGGASSGTIRISANDGGSISLLGGLTATADAFAGDALGAGVDGGDAAGGAIRIRTTGDNSNLTINGATSLSASAHGGRGASLECFLCDGDGGDGRGGDIDIYSDDGAFATLLLGGNAQAIADGYGGSAQAASAVAGTGYGGEAAFYVGTNARMVLNGTLLLQAEGNGGSHGGGNGGAGLGGEAAISETLTAASGTIVINGNVELSSDGQGGNTAAVGAIGGVGTGGGTTGSSYVLSDTGSIDINGSVSVHSSGTGGTAINGVGGAGNGGDARVTSNSRLTIFGTAGVTADGAGGAGASGGDATGGSSIVQTGEGGTVSIFAGATIRADGQGGASSAVSAGRGGDAAGGSAQLLASSGTITIGNAQINGGAALSADGTGGNANTGTAGDGFGGDIAQIFATNGGDIAIEGQASASASGFGGSGAIGGNGYGSGDYDALTETWSGGSHILARYGDIVINGGARVSSTGTGGDASSAGLAAGTTGGRGGEGLGGYATIHAGNSDLGPSSITVDAGESEGSGIALANVTGTGGDGASGGNGGAGGRGRGGTAGIHAAAGNGAVTIAHVVAYALGVGGTGGDGGNGSGGAGGNGGIGGAGRGGFVTVGTVSGAAQSVTVNQGLGDYGTVTVDVSGFGGDGGNGGFGLPNGNGGNGGAAQGGGVNLLVRGSQVNVDVATLTANATGGAGGLGADEPSSDGIGGNATVGSNAGPGFISGIDILVTGRFLIPSQRGMLNAGTITGTAIATGGFGALTSGISNNLGGSAVTFLNADGNIGSLDVIVDAAAQATGAVEESISVVNGDVLVDGEFSFVTSGNLSLFADNGSLTADTITLDATNFVPDTGTVTPVNAGTFFATSFDITTGNDFLTTAHLDSIAALTIVAPGAINVANITVDSALVLEAQGGAITANDLDVSGAIELDALAGISLNIVQAGFFRADAGGFFTSDDIISDSNIQIDTGGNVTLGDLDAGQTTDADSNKAIRIISGGSVMVGDINSVGGIDITAAEAVDGGNVVTGDVLFTDALGAIEYGNISAGLVNPQAPVEPFSVGLVSGVSIDVGTVGASRGIAFASPGTLTSGNLTTARDVLALVDGAIDIGSIDADGRVLLADYSMYTNAGGTIPTDGNFNPETVFAAPVTASSGSITVGDVLAGSLHVSAGTLVDIGSIDTGNGAVSLFAGSGSIAGEDVDAGSITTISGGNTILGNLDAGGNVYQRAGGTISEGDVNAGGHIDGRSTGGLALGSLMAGDYIDLRSNGSIALGNAVSGETINFLAGGTVTGGALTAGNSVLAEAIGAIRFGAITAGISDPSVAPGAEYGARFSSSGAITIGTVNAVGRIGFGTPANLVTGNLTSGGGLMALVGGNITSGAVNASAYVYLANYSMSALGGPFATFNRAPILALPPVATGGSVLLGAVDTGRFEAAAGTTLTGTTITSDGLLHATSGGNIILGNLSAGGNVRLTSGSGTITAGTIGADDFVNLFAAGTIKAGTINAGSYIDVYSDTGLIDFDDLHAGTQIDLQSGGSLQFGDATARNFDFEIGGSVNGGSITALDHATGQAAGAIVLENITVTGPPNDGDFSIGFVSATSITVQNVDGFDLVGFATLGDLRTGTITAGTLAVTLVGGDTITGSITTDAGGRVYMADASMCGGACGNDDSDVHIDSILALAPVATGGSITVNGGITTGQFQAAAGDGLATRAITATSIRASARTTATIDGLWNSPSVSLASGNINITANGRIAAGSSGSILLNAVSTSGPALIGDGLSGNGYALSNAEFGRLSGRDITIAVSGSGGDAVTLVGNLTITGPLASGIVQGSHGGVSFATLSQSSNEPDGTLRVVGNVLATGFGAENYLGFSTQNFELDAATGSIAITGSGTSLAGMLELYAGRIHVAQGSILDQLAVNPQFAGYREALNAPAAVQRPEGVIRAASFDIEFGDANATGPYTLFVQNTGTVALPAGFLLTDADIGGDDGGSGLSAGSVDMAINGQIVTANGTSTGVAVRDLLVTEFGTAAFVAGSSINGCPLTGSCGVTAPSIDTPRGTDIPLGGSDGLGDGLFGNEGDIAEGEGSGESGRTSPISPPNPLFDSRPLVQSGDIDDPVSGAGNPSLYGTPDDDFPACDPSKDKTCKTVEKGDGK